MTMDFEDILKDSVLRSILEDQIKAAEKREQENPSQQRYPDKLTYREFRRMMLNYNPRDPFPLRILPEITVTEK